ncbi:MAG: hypothetical protein IIA81_06660 [Thaumarchaeota archaeon]|nr:hypothetical protein [Nitrososphaerota archaeon]
MFSDSLRLCASEWRILRAFTELGRSKPEGVSGSDLKKVNGIQTGTWGEYRDRLESDHLIKFLGISKKGHEKKLYKITDIGFITLLRNYDAKKLHNEYSPKWLYENIPLIDADLWHKLEQEIGSIFPYFVMAMAINSLNIYPFYPEPKDELEKSVIQVKYETPVNDTILVGSSIYSNYTREEIDKLRGGMNFNYPAIDEFQEPTSLMEDLAIQFYLYLLQQLSKPIMLFAYWKESKKLNIKGNSRILKKFEKKGEELKQEMAEVILKNPRLEKIFKDQYEGISNFLSLGETWLKTELGYVGKIKKN